MNVTIGNNYLTVKIKQKGAELFSVIHKENNLEYMWSGDPAFWGKTSPVLFPIVGTLKDNAFFYKDTKYSLPRHGFARDADFEVSQQQENSVTFLLRSDAVTFEKYPFHFELRLSYAVIHDSLHMTYEVRNTGKEEMYFSIGGHPAFKVPLTESSRYEDHYLEFNKKENAGRWPISKNGLIEKSAVPVMHDTNKLPLTKELFYQDALVFKRLLSESVSIKSHKHDHGLDFNFTGFPFLGIWAAKNADFVCIEPWCGIADGVGHDQQVVTKEGIEKIPGGTGWPRTWSVRFY